MKKLLLSVSVLLIAGTMIFFSSFRSERAKNFSRAWFHCTNPGSPGSAGSYEYLDGQSPSCSGSTDVCAVYADIANPNDPTSEQYPVALAVNGSGGSLEDLAEESEGFSMTSENVKLEQ